MNDLKVRRWAGATRYVRVVVVSRGTGTEAQGGSPLGEKIAGRKDFRDAILP